MSPRVLLTMLVYLFLCTSLTIVSGANLSFNVPPSRPSSARTIDPALLGVSLEFFTFPAYTQIAATTNCLANIQAFRGTPPPVRIGGTTQDRAAFNPNDVNAVTYTVPSPVNAPDFLSYGPAFFHLAAQLPGEVTVGLNRQLNNQSNSFAAARLAQAVMPNLLSIEFGNEPEFYNSSSPIIPKGTSWSPAADAASQDSWFTSLGNSLGQIFQGAVYLQEPTWGTAELVPKLTTGLQFIRSFSGHSYPQSACGGAATNLTALMNHPNIVSYTSRYRAEAAAAQNAGKHYYLAETNSATCGGGGISPTFGAALWIVDYSLQAALQGVERLYFHQGTIAACPYCWWNDTIVNAPYYGTAFLSAALGNNTSAVSQLDDSSTALAAYALYDLVGSVHTLIVINSQLFNGTNPRPSLSLSFSGIAGPERNVPLFRLTAPSALAQISSGDKISFAGGSYSGDCQLEAEMHPENILLTNGSVSITVAASEALFIRI